jgi:hypothetical protein
MVLPPLSICREPYRTIEAVSMPPRRQDVEMACPDTRPRFVSRHVTQQIASNVRDVRAATHMLSVSLQNRAYYPMCDREASGRFDLVATRDLGSRPSQGKPHGSERHHKGPGGPSFNGDEPMAIRRGVLSSGWPGLRSPRPRKWANSAHERRRMHVRITPADTRRTGLPMPAPIPEAITILMTWPSWIIW